MKFQELDVVCLTKAVPGSGLSVGAVGAVVMTYTNPREAFEVEFVGEDGDTIAMLPLEPNFLALVNTPARLAA